MTRLSVLAASAALALTFSGIAVAKGSSCQPLKTWEAKLKSLGEKLMGVAVGQSGPLRIYVNPSSRSWTVLVRVSGRTACLADSGSAFDLTSGGKTDIQVQSNRTRKTDKGVFRPIKWDRTGPPV